MCGRYVEPDAADLERFWLIDRRNWVPFGPTRFNVAPTMQVPIVVRHASGSSELRGARWGLIPRWWQKSTLPTLSFNARSEEAAGKPLWSESLQHFRCLLPVRGWYEWNEREQTRSDRGKRSFQPYFLSCPGEPVVAFAGLWSVWQRAGAEPVVSCALLTRDAAPAIAAIHHRMPVVLHPDLFEDWLAPGHGTERAMALIRQARQDLQGHPVSTRVNSVRNEGPDLISALALPQQPALF